MFDIPYFCHILKTSKSELKDYCLKSVGTKKYFYVVFTASIVLFNKIKEM